VNAERKPKKSNQDSKERKNATRKPKKGHKYCKITDSLILLTTYGRVYIFNLLTVREEVRGIKQTETKKSATNLKNA
jgi:hypothetical protein